MPLSRHVAKRNEARRALGENRSAAYLMVREQRKRGQVLFAAHLSPRPHGGKAEAKSFGKGIFGVTRNKRQQVGMLPAERRDDVHGGKSEAK